MITFLIAHLLADVTLGAAIGTRMRPGMLAQNETLPAVTYAQVSRVAPRDRDDPPPEPAGVVFTRWQFDVYARTYEQATALTRALMARAQTFKRTSAPHVSRVFADDVSDPNIVDYDELPYYRRVVDLQVIAEDV